MTHIAVYERDLNGTFVEKVVREFDFEADVCTQFAFNKKDEDELYFFTPTHLFAYRYMDMSEEAIRNVYTLRDALNCQPNFGIFNKD